MLLVFSLGTVFYQFNDYKWSQTLPNFLYHLSLIGLIALSSFVIGGLGGFLFGIPIPKAKSTGDSQNTYEDNDNLVQVSDWLTKIIVGVGLTQLVQIPDKLTSMGEKLKPAFYSGPIGELAAIATLLYFGVTGFTLTYLWTRLYFKKMLIRSDNEILRMLPSYLNVGIQPTDFKEKQYPLPAYLTKNLGAAKPPSNEDPQKHQWGEKAEVNDRKLSAKVTEVNWTRDYFNVELEVRSINPDKPLQGKVIFHLHPSFRNSDPEVDVIGGVAKLNLLAYGAFTVGAEADNGETRLELDLAELSAAPAAFRSR
jgi:hypothetical protein